MAGRIGIFVTVCLTMAALPPTAEADMVGTATWSGPSGTGTAVRVEAEMSIEGDILTVKLSNTSMTLPTPSPSDSPDDVLGSFYFNLVDSSGHHPTLSYLNATATGGVYQTSQMAADTLTFFTASRTGDGLVTYSTNPNKVKPDGWEFKQGFNEAQAPYLPFGLGTIGNNLLSPNNFNGNLVDGLQYSIYAGDVTTANLAEMYLIKEIATFTFAGASGFTIGPEVVFGLGTAPDAWHTAQVVPLPAAVLLGMLGMGVAGMKLRKFV